jgi:hypothetical protein
MLTIAFAIVALVTIAAECCWHQYAIGTRQ